MSSSGQDRAAIADWLADTDGVVALVFMDVVGSTLLLYARETLNFRGMLRAHRARAIEAIEQHGGRLVDQTGDAHFVVFRGASPAYAFALELLRDTGHPKIRIRAGVHFGHVRTDGNEVVGRNVHLGARVMHHASDQELWLSDVTKAALESESPDLAAGITWISHGEYEFKGVPTHQLLWRAR
jgi:class 3 adenylate cyclase